MFYIIAITSLLASLLTFFSGFGLGTILLPVFALFFDLKTSIALTAIVHFLNNGFKFFLVRRTIDKNIVLKFGIPSLIFAFIGAYLLDFFSHSPELFSYAIHQRAFTVTLTSFVIGVLMLVFSLWEILPFTKNLGFEKSNLVLGGAVSGFFGGLSGHQGALRSAFLIKLGLKKEFFIGTGIAIACLVDLARLSVYSQSITKETVTQNAMLICTAALFAWIGALAGNKLLKKTTNAFIKWFVFVFMVMISLLIMSGIISK